MGSFPCIECAIRMVAWQFADMAKVTEAAGNHLSFGNVTMDCGDPGCFLKSHFLCLLCTWFRVRWPRMLMTRAPDTPSVRWEVNQHQMEKEPRKGRGGGLCLTLMLRG